jgi:hypothetical protein
MHLPWHSSMNFDSGGTWGGGQDISKMETFKVHSRYSTGDVNTGPRPGGWETLLYKSFHSVHQASPLAALNSLVPLTTGMMMPETCCELINQEINTRFLWHLVGSYYLPTLTMRGHTNIKLPALQPNLSFDLSMVVVSGSGALCCRNGDAFQTLYRNWSLRLADNHTPFLWK